LHGDIDAVLRRNAATASARSRDSFMLNSVVPRTSVCDQNDAGPLLLSATISSRAACSPTPVKVASRYSR
jgi:hypothetical protein